MRSLSPPQRNMAILSDKAPRDILTGQDSVIDRKTFFPPKGLPITKMNSRQKAGSQKSWKPMRPSTALRSSSRSRPATPSSIPSRPISFGWAPNGRAKGTTTGFKPRSFSSNTIPRKTTPIRPCGLAGLRRRFRSRPAGRTFGQGCPRQGLGQYVRRQDSQGMESK